MARSENADTSVVLCGMPLKNPLIIAAGPFGASGEKISRYTIPRADPGAVETKVMFTRRLPYFAKYVSPARAWGYSLRGDPDPNPSEGYTLMPGGPGVVRTLEQWLETDFQMAVAAGRRAGIPIILNGPSPVTDPEVLRDAGSSVAAEIEKMAELAHLFEAQGAAAVEALFHAFHVPGYGWQNWPYVAEILSALEAAVKVPVIVKLPHHPDIVEVVQRLEDMGADAVIVSGIAPHQDINVEAGRTYRPTLSGSDAFTGALLKPLALSNILQCREAGVRIPMIASGGVTHARDVIAYIMAGATAVHLLTATVLDGLGLCKRINREVGSWLTRHGYSAVSDVRGSVASHWSRAEIDELENVDVVVDESLCDGCGLCLRYCQEAVEGAISIVGGKAKIDPVLCHRCTMCALVCPVDKAAITVTGWNG